MSNLFIGATYFAAVYKFHHVRVSPFKKKYYCETDQPHGENRTKCSVCSKRKGFSKDKFQAVKTADTPIMYEECKWMQNRYKQHQFTTKFNRNLTSNTECGDCECGQKYKLVSTGQKLKKLNWEDNQIKEPEEMPDICCVVQTTLAMSLQSVATFGSSLGVCSRHKETLHSIGRYENCKPTCQFNNVTIQDLLRLLVGSSETLQNQKQNYDEIFSTAHEDLIPRIQRRHKYIGKPLNSLSDIEKKPFFSLVSDMKQLIEHEHLQLIEHVTREREAQEDEAYWNVTEITTQIPLPLQSVKCFRHLSCQLHASQGKCLSSLCGAQNCEHCMTANDVLNMASKCITGKKCSKAVSGYLFAMNFGERSVVNRTVDQPAMKVRVLICCRPGSGDECLIFHVHSREHQVFKNVRFFPNPRIRVPLYYIIVYSSLVSRSNFL